MVEQAAAELESVNCVLSVYVLLKHQSTAFLQRRRGDIRDVKRIIGFVNKMEALSAAYNTSYVHHYKCGLTHAGRRKASKKTTQHDFKTQSNRPAPHSSSIVA